MGSGPQSIQSLLHIAAPEIADILGRARFLSRMRVALLDVLPEAAAQHIRIAAYEDFTLSLHAANAAWATRLRYMESELCRALAQRMRLQVDRVRIQVRPSQLDALESAGKPRYLSASTRDHLQQTAGHVGNSELADALRRLAGAGRS